MYFCSNKDGIKIDDKYVLMHAFVVVALFRKKRFLVNLKTERNAAKFAMFMEKENPRSFFRFSFRATFIFPL